VIVKKLFGLFVFVALLFSACAPSVPGSSRYSPIDARDNDFASITAGSEWFVKTLGYIGLVDLSTRDDGLDPLFTSRSDISVGTVKSRSVNWLKVQDIKAPAGWIIELVGQEASRRITEVGSSSYRLIDTMTLTWLVKAPPATLVGEYPILLLVTSANNAGRALPIVLNVEITQPKG
jgi:hypothetical protein